MNQPIDKIFCKILQVALGLSQDFPYTPTEKEWETLYTMAARQTLLGVAYNAIERLPKASQPPIDIALSWSQDAEAIRGKNRQMNQEAAHYTQIFAEKGFRSAILKGQANARLYPDPFSRHPGDIDIWVSGGYDNIKKMLQDIGIKAPDPDQESHHVAFKTPNGVEIEVHHKPCADIHIKNNEFQKLLTNELEMSKLTPEGFYSPSIRLALLMQLVHIQKHIIGLGIGFRHYMDYFILLTQATKEDRDFAWFYAKKFGMRFPCSAIMGVLEIIFGLPREKMLCKPSKIRSKYLYNSSLKDGNFGFNKMPNKKTKSKQWYRIKLWFKRRINKFYKFPINPLYVIITEIKYWKYLISSIPERIRRRSITR